MDAQGETITGGRMVTREFAEWIADLQPSAVPDSVLDEACRSFADFLGESLFVGGLKEWGKGIAAFCAADGGGQPEATIIATGQRTLASRAALANGTMALGFEYADFGAGSRPYPFAVTAPLALAESRHRSGRGPRAGHRNRVRGDGPRVPRHFHEADPILRSLGVRHPWWRRWFCSGARAACSSDEPRARPGLRVHRRHLPGARGRRRGSDP